MESLDYYLENRSDNEQTFYHVLKKKIQKYFWVFFQLFFHTAYPYPKDEKIASKWLNLRVISKFYRASNLAKNKFEKKSTFQISAGELQVQILSFICLLHILQKSVSNTGFLIEANFVTASLSKPKTTTA